MNLRQSLSFGILLCILMPAYSQVTIGLVAFPQISALSSKVVREDAVMKNRFSYAGGAGVMVGYDFSEAFGMQVGILYSAQNQKIKSEYTLSGEKFTHMSRKRFDYLKVPILFKKSFPILQSMRRKEGFNFSLFAGPQISYLLKYDGGMVVYIPDVYFDLPPTPSDNKYYKKVVVDLAVGAGLDFPLSMALTLNTGVKVDIALTDAENKNAKFNDQDLVELNGQTSGAARNVTTALLVGVTYRFGGMNDFIAPSNKFRGKSYGKKKRYK